MALEDPHSRQLRGLIGNAVRYGDVELEAELRQELRVVNAERALRKKLDGGRPLTSLQVRTLKAVVESFGPQAVRAAQSTDPDAVVA